MYYKLTPISEPPTKEDRYVVTEGYGFFEVYWDERYSFHDEDTDCSSLTHYLAPVEELPGGMRWVKASERMPDKVVTWRFTDKSASGIDDLRNGFRHGTYRFTPDIVDYTTIEWLDEQPSSHISVTTEQLRAMAEAMKVRGWLEQADIANSNEFPQFVDEYLKQHFGI